MKAERLPNAASPSRHECHSRRLFLLVYSRGRAEPLRWLASKEALLHPEADARMTIQQLIEYCGTEGGGGGGGGSVRVSVV